MRILDLGAHDGFVSMWVADQFGLENVTRLDGVELNAEGVRIFNERLAARGLAGECKQGLAEDAPGLFPMDSYDAVIAYEIIEHVTDPEWFLERCEQMLAPGGRLYISTPEGTFGEGSNPHHLRVYRITDLLDLARDRGELQNAEVGPDTIASVAYTPWRCMENPPPDRGDAAIYTGPGWQPWSPLSIEEPGGLGGSETAAVRTAEELQKRGYRVTVYGEVQDGCHAGVLYRPWSTFDPLARRELCILSRTPSVLDRPVNAARVVLWAHDTDFGAALTQAHVDRCEKVVCLGVWHLEHLLSHYDHINFGQKLLVLGNGIEPSYFDGQDVERVPHRAVFTSSPDRGLDLLLQLWPKVRERVPDAELVYCYADVYDAVARQRPEIAAFRQTLNALSDQDGVTNMGALSQPDVARLMLSAEAWLHPSYCTPAGMPFEETFCIGALEASAAGCALVVAGRGALVERADEAGAVVALQGNDEQEWVDAIAWAITEAGHPAPDVTHRTWAAVAEGLLAALG